MLKPKTYQVLLQAVEEGVLLGVNRANKRFDEDFPTDVLAGCIADAVMECVLDWFNIEEYTES